MLQELPNVRQLAGEPKRRWFFCHEIDLVIFEDEKGICGFQLAYDKQRNEHSFTWDRKRGFTHYIVDDGEPIASVNNTPFLYANGPFKSENVLEQFLALSLEVPSNIAAFVEGKLREFSEPTPPI